MSLIAEQLHYRKAGVTYDINLYSAIGDLGGASYVSFQVSGATVYAALGTTGHASASGLRVRISGTTYAFLTQASVALPSGLIAMFDASCPSGWTRVGDFDETFIRGAAIYGSTGGGDHNHSITIAAGTSSSHATSLYECAHTTYLRSIDRWGPHDHDYTSHTFNSGVTENLPPYVDVVFCKKD